MRAVVWLAVALSAGAAERYQVTLRLPADGLYAREEMQIEFRVEDTTVSDPLSGFAPVARLAPATTIDMPTMAGMPKIVETAHAEGAAGEYGVHPTFAHGGEYRLRIAIQPPNGEAFTREFALAVKDADPKRKPAPPRFTLELTSEPKRPKAGEPVLLRLMVRDRESAGAVSAFEIVHEKPMHLIAVRKDLAHFAHVHPEWSGPEFRLTHVFPSGGEYRIFADVAPRGAGSHVLMARLKVAGPETREAAFEAAEVVSGDALPSRRSSAVVFRIPGAGELEPYLGAAGHLILIHEDGETFVHSHPLDETAVEGQLRFSARLPKAGLYRGWLQFQRAGRVTTLGLQVRGSE